MFQILTQNICQCGTLSACWSERCLASSYTVGLEIEWTDYISLFSRNIQKHLTRTKISVQLNLIKRWKAAGEGRQIRSSTQLIHISPTTNLWASRLRKCHWFAIKCSPFIWSSRMAYTYLLQQCTGLSIETPSARITNGKGDVFFKLCFLLWL